MDVKLPCLRVTTSKPGFFGSTSKPLKVPEDLGVVISLEEKKARNFYIHGEAESLAGYDIPIILDGDMNNLNLPVEQQNILLLLPSGEYKCKATIEQDLVDKAYYLTLVEDMESLKD